MNRLINIVYEDNHLLVVEKPVNIPVQKDISEDNDLLTILKNYIKLRDKKPGNVYLGLVHRLDRPVGGIMVFAKTSKCASRLSEQVRERLLKKTYYAVCIGKLDKNGILIDKLYKDKKNNIVKVDEKGKEAVLNYELIKFKDNMSLIRINLQTGRSHQIRVQFASRRHPLYGDQKYNYNSKPGEQIALFASSISFIHPTTKKKLTFSLDLPSTYPWNMFK